jgi:shikimate dehydrogenase
MKSLKLCDRLYQFIMSLSTRYFRLGLIGYPISHSLSPKIQNAALQACGLEGEYSLYPIHSDDTQGLKDLLARVRTGEIKGLNVTIPHKQNVIPLLDELTLTAGAIGAVNVIYLRNQKLIGDNTDAAGFSSDLKRFLTTEPRFSTGMIRHEDLSALVLGAGGSARAAVYALLNDGWGVTIAARRMEQAQELGRSFTNFELSITQYKPSTFQLSDFQLIVNTTPIGMTPQIDQSPLPQDLSIPEGTRIYDLVYNPRETKLVKDARAQGLQATTGLGMLIEQAALAFELWTGHTPPRELLWNAVEN